jgi:hypothetical protein
MLKVVRLKEPVIRVFASAVFEEASSHRTFQGMGSWGGFCINQTHFLEIRTYIGSFTEAQAEQLLVWEMVQNIKVSQETQEIYLYLWLNVLPSMVLWGAICTLQPMETPKLFYAVQWVFTENGPYERWLCKASSFTYANFHDTLWSQMLDSGFGLSYGEKESWGSAEPLPLLEKLLL